MPDPIVTPPMRQSLGRIALKVAVIIGVVLVVQLIMKWALATGTNAQLMGGLLVLLLLAYALFIAVPFMPGIEIGITLIVLHGYTIVPFVYLATVVGLMTAFLMGRFLPYGWLHQLFLDLRMTRACSTLERMEQMSRDEKLAVLRQRIPGRLGNYVIQYRYVMLGLLLNLPGNTVIGGGGGIAMVAGLSRIYLGWVTLLTIALAVAPVPLAVWVLGIDILGPR